MEFHQVPMYYGLIIPVACNNLWISGMSRLQPIENIFYQDNYSIFRHHPRNLVIPRYVPGLYCQIIFSRIQPRPPADQVQPISPLSVSPNDLISSPTVFFFLHLAYLCLPTVLYLLSTWIHLDWG